MVRGLDLYSRKFNTEADVKKWMPFILCIVAGILIERFTALSHRVIKGA